MHFKFQPEITSHARFIAYTWQFLILRRSACVLLLCGLITSGCGLNEGKLDPSFSFSQRSPNALVLGNINASESPDITALTLLFKQYDTQSQRLISDGHILFIDTTNGPILAYEIPPGDYVMYYYMHPVIPVFEKAFVAKEDIFGLGAIELDASVGGIETYRFSVAAGEILYLGEYEVGPYKPKWVHRQQNVEAFLANLPNVKGQYVFRPPVRSSGG